MARTQPIRRDRIGKPLREHDPARTSLPELFAAYLHAKRRSISEATRRACENPYGSFGRWLRERGLPAVVGSFTVDHVERYADYLRERPPLPGRRGFDGASLSPASQHAYLRPLSQFGDWLAWEGWIAVNPFSQTYGSLLPKLETVSRLLRSATAADVRALLGATSGTDALARRDHALLLTAWETGMRTQDLIGLDLADLDMRTGHLTIRHCRRHRREPWNEARGPGHDRPDPST